MCSIRWGTFLFNIVLCVSSTSDDRSPFPSNGWIWCIHGMLNLWQWCVGLGVNSWITSRFLSTLTFMDFSVPYTWLLQDAVSRKISLDTLVDFALSQGSQWIFITPHDIRYFLVFCTLLSLFISLWIIRSMIGDFLLELMRPNGEQGAERKGYITS